MSPPACENADFMAKIEPPRVHPNDPNYLAHPEHYFTTGPSAIRLIGLAQEAAEVLRPLQRILDLPCGYGRILRALRESFPDADLTACDISKEAVDFCAEAFGAEPVYSSEDPAAIKVEGQFDLIWCGSLLTHLEAARWDGFLDFFETRLARRGLLIFTTHGRDFASALRAGRTFGIPAESVEGLLADYDREGFGYRDYPTSLRDAMNWESRGYGFSVAAPAWVCARITARPGLRLVSYLERGFKDSQDAIACLKVQ
jgi:SAM-dependent methyltransferase